MELDPKQHEAFLDLHQKASDLERDLWRLLYFKDKAEAPAAPPPLELKASVSFVQNLAAQVERVVNRNAALADRIIRLENTVENHADEIDKHHDSLEVLDRFHELTLERLRLHDERLCTLENSLKLDR